MKLIKKNIKKLKKCGFKVSFPKDVYVLSKIYPIVMSGKSSVTLAGRKKYFLRLEGQITIKLSKVKKDICKIKTINIPLTKEEFEILSKKFNVLNNI